jgi:drug/metabolite transporter (DMT)-like permease
MRIVIYATLAMLAFAANSILCRVALRQSTIDPASFSTIRLISGAATLLLVAHWKQSVELQRRSCAPALLALYAVPFSFAYTRLSAGTGALILFGCVQVTMLIAALRAGENVRHTQWVGLSLALSGLVYLVSPTLATPSLAAALLMAVAGVSWGAYSWRGRGTANPLAATTRNFVQAVPLVLLVSLVTFPQSHIEPSGLVLAVASGAIASGLGYVVWYAALRGLSGLQAAVVQLAVPVLAAVGGVVFLSEAISVRLALSTILVLGGIALAVASRERWLRSRLGVQCARHIQSI